MTGGMLFYILYDLSYFFLCLFGGMVGILLFIIIVFFLIVLLKEVGISGFLKTALFKGTIKEFFNDYLFFLLRIFHILLVLFYMSSLVWSTFWVIHQIYIIDFKNKEFFTIYHFIDFCGLLFLSLIFLGIIYVIINLICFFIVNSENLKDYW